MAEESTQKPAPGGVTGAKGPDPKPKDGTTAPPAERPAPAKDTPQTSQAQPSKEDSGVVPKSQFINLQKAHAEALRQNENLAKQLQSLNISPVVDTVRGLQESLETSRLEDLMWRVKTTAEAGDIDTATQIAQREVNRQLASLGLTSETMPAAVRREQDPLARLNAILIYRSFVNEQKPRSDGIAPEAPAKNESPISEKIQGKTLEEWEAEFLKKHGLLNATTASPAAATGDLGFEPDGLLRAGLAKLHRSDDE